MIQKLPPHLIHQIAAGEVIERPSSALKELLENSIDAGATKIQIEYEGGGLDRLTVEDNGTGIPEGDFPLVFEAHATSKLQALEDFDDLRSLGFRGEALAAMGQIAEVELESSTFASLIGHRLIVRFGTHQPLHPVDKRVGTRVTLRRLFAQHPVRLKFLKSPRSEAMALNQLFRKYALAYPEIAFEFGEAGKPKLKLNSQSRLERTLWYFDSDEESSWFSFGGSEAHWKVSGIGLLPARMGSVKSQIVLRLNRRPIRDSQLEFAVRRAFDGYTENTRDVAVSLDLEGDPKDFDVNVHPTKAEVRFRNAEGLFSLIVSSIRRSLEVSHRARPEVVVAAIPSVEVPLVPVPTISEVSVRSPDLNHRQLGLSLPIQVLSPYSYLGVIDRTYLVARREEDLYLFDQHALHERILYEKLLREFQVESRVKSQRLLFPQTLRFEQAEKLLEHEELLQRLGFEIRQWRESSISILATPALLRREPEKILKKFVECAELPVETMARDVLATMACHSAVRAHDVLAEAEVEELFRQFDSQDALGHCPHGRPTFVRWTGRDLEKLFHRVL
jgi:DNA mismatch repair protein MutL